MCHPGIAPTPAYHSHFRPSAPSMEESGRRSIWSSIGSAAGKACAMPFRLASTAVNGAVFAAYYVTTVTVTGLAAVGGTAFGMGKIAADAVRGKPHKSLREYAITPARETFNFISRLYYELPKRGPEVIFAGVAIAAVVTLAILASKDRGSGNDSYFVWIDTTHHHYPGDGPHPSSREHPDDDYNPSGFRAALHPYRPAIVLGRKIMGKTIRILNRGQQVD